MYGSVPDSSVEELDIRWGWDWSERYAALTLGRLISDHR